MQLLRIGGLVLIIVVVAGALPLSAQSTWCDDCTRRVEYDDDGDIVAEEGLCCMADSYGRCYGGYFVVKPNVGWDCIIVATAMGTECITYNRDTNCGSSDAGGGSEDLGGDPDDQTSECVYQEGYCPPECGSCTW